MKPGFIDQSRKIWQEDNKAYLKMRCCVYEATKQNYMQIIQWKHYDNNGLGNTQSSDQIKALNVSAQLNDQLESKIPHLYFRT